jgi:hypothetical protein
MGLISAISNGLAFERGVLIGLIALLVGLILLNVVTRFWRWRSIGSMNGHLLHDLAGLHRREPDLASCGGMCVSPCLR